MISDDLATRGAPFRYRNHSQSPTALEPPMGSMTLSMIKRPFTKAVPEDFLRDRNLFCNCKKPDQGLPKPTGDMPDFLLCTAQTTPISLGSQVLPAPRVISRDAGLASTATPARDLRRVALVVLVLRIFVNLPGGFLTRLLRGAPGRTTRSKDATNGAAKHHSWNTGCAVSRLPSR